MTHHEVNSGSASRSYPYHYTASLLDPDWRRLPGYRNVTTEEWHSALWQRENSVTNVKQLKQVFTKFLTDEMANDILRDQAARATMSTLVPPQMINTMKETDLKNDPIRRYMFPAISDRHPHWPSHPKATRDSLHESDMSVIEGLVHRYPTKILAQIVTTCPQYCGHCTRLDIVGGNSTSIKKRRFQVNPADRYEAMLQYIRITPSIRDVVVSGGDIANVPTPILKNFVTSLLDIDHIRDIRLATKALIGMPQYFLQDDVLRVLDCLAQLAVSRGVDIAIHTHVNHANSLTLLTGQVTRKLLSMGFRDIRNQGVILAGVNDSFQALLDLCFQLIDHAKITPYYFYMCDMIPNAEHWRISLSRAQQLQDDIMGYLPGFATPRLVCDVPLLGKKWAHQCQSYDQVLGISYWTKNYSTSIEIGDADDQNKFYAYYDPIHTLPPEGQDYWIDEINHQKLLRT